MDIYLKIAFRLTIISILLKRDLTSYNIYYDGVPFLKPTIYLGQQYPIQFKSSTSYEVLHDYQ